MDQRTKYWVDKVANVYFHLNMACLQNFDPSLNEENLTMTNEIFCNISQQHLQHLRQLTLHLMLMKEVKLPTKHRESQSLSLESALPGITQANVLFCKPRIGRLHVIFPCK